MARAIDANILLEKLQRMIDYCKNDNQVNGLTALFQVGDAIMDCPTLTPPNEPLTCTGCMYSPDCPSEIHCFGCARLYTDNYRRPPEGEGTHDGH